MQRLGHGQTCDLALVVGQSFEQCWCDGLPLLLGEWNGSSKRASNSADRACIADHQIGAESTVGLTPQFCFDRFFRCKATAGSRSSRVSTTRTLTWNWRSSLRSCSVSAVVTASLLTAMFVPPAAAWWVVYRFYCCKQLGGCRRQGATRCNALQELVIGFDNALQVSREEAQGLSKRLSLSRALAAVQPTRCRPALRMRWLFTRRSISAVETIGLPERNRVGLAGIQ